MHFTSQFWVVYETLQSHTILAHIHMYTDIHTHAFVDIQEMHYLLLMIRWLCTMTWLMTLLFIFKHLMCYRWRKTSLLLLRRPNNPTPWLRGLLRGCSWGFLHNTIPRCRGTRGSSRCLVFLFSAVCRNKILLGDGQIHQIIERISPNKI